MNRRAEVREQRHAAILTAAAAIIAERGYHSTRLEDIGQAVGISGPGLYRYVTGKEDLLGQILVDISVRLVAGAEAVVKRSESEGWSPNRTMRELINFHVNFAVTDPDRIRVQEREGRNLGDEALDTVRSLQRKYLDIWINTLMSAQPGLTREDARIKVQLAAGLINSSRHTVRRAGPERVRHLATEMATAGLGM